MFLLILVLAATFGGFIGFGVGYVVGQRSAARLHQRGFPIARPGEPPER